MKTRRQGGARWAGASACIVAQPSSRVAVDPDFVSLRLAPHGFLGSPPMDQHGVTGASWACRGSRPHQTDVMRPSGFGAEPKARRDGVDERPLLDAEPCWLGLLAITEQHVQRSAERWECATIAIL